MGYRRSSSIAMEWLAEIDMVKIYSYLFHHVVTTAWNEAIAREMYGAHRLGEKSVQS